MVIEIREATANDVSTILDMLNGLAEYTNVPTPSISIEDLQRDGGFDENNKIPPLYIAFLAEDSAITDANGDRLAVGLAMCSFMYTYEGKSIFLNDLFVNPSHRSRGIGQLLFNSVLKYAKQTDRECVDLYVVDWNPARKLYEHLGATNVNEKLGVQLHRIYKDVIDSVDV